MKVSLISKTESGTTGLSRYVESLQQGLQQLENVDVHITTPTSSAPTPLSNVARRFGLDMGAFFSSYPLRSQLPEADVYHLTSQTLATLLNFQRIRPVVVTVHDIIPYLVRHDPEMNTFHHPLDYFFYRLSLAGLKRADALIAISEYTKRTLVEALEIPEERIHVVYRAVEHDRFRPLEVPDSFHQQYGLDKSFHHILYVGSEDPRKNLKTLVSAFARVKEQLNEVKLIKVGAPHFLDQRMSLLTLVEKLDLKRDVLFYDHVPAEDLPLFYNFAEVFAFPSLFEGFGLPVLEAMACGTPVVVADSASLPEVVGKVGIKVNPCNEEEIASQILYVLKGDIDHGSMAKACIEHSLAFNTNSQAFATRDIYTKAYHENCSF